jgi:hypothetical protein
MVFQISGGFPRAVMARRPRRGRRAMGPAVSLGVYLLSVAMLLWLAKVLANMWWF